jgi:hypothetical protein
LARVLLHGLVDQIVYRALQLASHLLKGFPQYVSALKGAGALFVRVTHQFALDRIASTAQRVVLSNSRMFVITSEP